MTSIKGGERAVGTLVVFWAMAAAVQADPGDIVLTPGDIGNGSGFNWACNCSSVYGIATPDPAYQNELHDFAFELSGCVSGINGDQRVTRYCVTADDLLAGGYEVDLRGNVTFCETFSDVESMTVTQNDKINGDPPGQIGDFCSGCDMGVPMKVTLQDSGGTYMGGNTGTWTQTSLPGNCEDNRACVTVNLDCLDDFLSGCAAVGQNESLFCVQVIHCESVECPM